MKSQDTSCVELLPLNKRWETTIAVVREVIRFRRSQPLSDALIHTDPNGTLVLRPSAFGQIRSGMNVDEAISMIGSQPYQDESSIPRLMWYTLGGSWVHLSVGADRRKVSGKSYHSVIARHLQLAPSYIECFEHSMKEAAETSSEQRNELDSWLSLSTKEIIAYFLKHSNREQRQWFFHAVSGAVEFRIEKIAGKKSIQFVFDDVEEPALWGEEIFQNPEEAEFCLDEDSPEPFGVRNDLSDSQVEACWQLVIELGSPQALMVRNRLMKAVNNCDNFCDEESRLSLLQLLQQGHYLQVEEMAEQILAAYDRRYIADMAAKVKKREEQGPIYGREYKHEEEGPLWHWYSVLVYHRDDYRCQYCGVRNDEHENPLYHVDHICPVSRGGKTELTNLQLLCEPCNLRKGATTEDKFSEDVRAKWYKNRRSE